MSSKHEADPPAIATILYDQLAKQNDALRAENERLQDDLVICQAENDRLTVELTHRVGWEERALDAEATAARLERQNAELAREAIGMKAAWMDVKANGEQLTRDVSIREIRMRQAETRQEAAEIERDALRTQLEQARELYAAMLAELNALRAALERISRESGQVCPDFETCSHEPCQGSLAAKLIALEVLGHHKVG
jgi:chromosome segregation ATPase